MRTVVWVQGCSLGCPGCFNPRTHSRSQRLLIRPEDLTDSIKRERENIEGVTISGGEPFEQSEALCRLLKGIRADTNLSVILFSGLEMGEIEALPYGRDILRLTDVLIAGRFVQELKLSQGLRGSSNQRIHILTDRYSLSQLDEIPVAEVIVDRQGCLTVSGIDPPRISGPGLTSSEYRGLAYTPGERH